jgi:hypothetical protein
LAGVTCMFCSAAAVGTDTPGCIVAPRYLGPITRW